MTFMELCNKNEANPANWKEWLKSQPENINPYQSLGITEDEYVDLINNQRSFAFFVLKHQRKHSYHNIWVGCYIKFVYEIDLHEPHHEFGWIDAVNFENKFCKVQCDDSYEGGRALVIRCDDIVEILPHKERPLLFYKTMICGDCNDCDRISTEIPPLTCKEFEFFNAIISKQKADKEFINVYNKICESRAKAQHECNCGGDCHSHEEHEGCNGTCNGTCNGACGDDCHCKQEK